jgi:hypothetical protein
MAVHGRDIFGKKMELKPLHTRTEKQENTESGTAVLEKYKAEFLIYFQHGGLS